MTIAAAVTTAPRPGTTLLPRCVASLLQTGFQRPLVFAEPDAPVPAWIGDSAELVRWSGRLGAWRNFLYSMQETLQRRPDADAVLMVQDDTVFCRRAAQFLEQDTWPSPFTGVVQVCVSRAYHRQPRGLSRLDDRSNRDLAGAWACLFPRHVAYQIVAHGLSVGWQGHPRQTIDDPVKKIGIDPFIGRTVVEKLGYEVWVYNPSLGDHDAEHSALGHGRSNCGNRRALDFIGQDADPFLTVPMRGPRFELPTGMPRVTAHARPTWPELAVVIPMAGECHDLMRSCLGHLARFAGVRLLVIVIDNGTPKRVSEQVRGLAEDVGLTTYCLRNETNLGFTAAVNRGIRAADAYDVLLLNSDCRVGPNCIPLLLNTLARDPRIAAVGPLSLDSGHQSLRLPKRREQAGVHRVPPAENTVDLVWQLARNTVSPEPMLGFFCTLIRRRALARVGLLDESPELASGLCADDLWCKEARQDGWKLALHHGAFADHTHSETFRRLGLDRKALHQVALTKLRGEK